MDVYYIMLFSLTFASILTVGVCFPNGAPLCLMNHPHHTFTESQSGLSPFTITLSSPTYSPRQNINITVSAHDSREFKGLHLTVHRAPTSNNTEEFLGEFIKYPDDKLKLLSCLGGTQKPLTHKNSDPVTSVNVTWMAPENNVGDLVFEATVVENFTTFWYGIRTSLASASTNNVVAPPYTIPAVKTMFGPVNWPGCGKTKGCFLFPDTCSGLDCMAAVTYTVKGDKYTFEMFAITNGYVSLGFSDDKFMGDDETMSCVSDGNKLHIQQGYNPPGVKYNTRQYTKNMKDVEAKMDDGKIFCRFTLPRKLSVIQHDGAVKEIDLSRNWYLLMAWGSTPNGAAAISKHLHAPVVSATKLSLSYREISRVTISAASDVTGGHSLFYYVFTALILTYVC